MQNWTPTFLLENTWRFGIDGAGMLQGLRVISHMAFIGYCYLHDLKDVEKDAKKLIDEVNLLSSILHSLKMWPSTLKATTTNSILQHRFIMWMLARNPCCGSRNNSTGLTRHRLQIQRNWRRSSNGRLRNTRRKSFSLILRSIKQPWHLRWVLTKCQCVPQVWTRRLTARIQVCFTRPVAEGRYSSEGWQHTLLRLRNAGGSAPTYRRWVLPSIVPCKSGLIRIISR